MGTVLVKTLPVEVTAHIAKHSYCSLWIKEHGKGENAMEKLSRRVGTSVTVLRNTYVHHKFEASDWSTSARSVPFPRPKEAEAASSNLAGRMAQPGHSGSVMQQSGHVFGLRALPSVDVKSIARAGREREASVFLGLGDAQGAWAL